MTLVVLLFGCILFKDSLSLLEMLIIPECGYATIVKICLKLIKFSDFTLSPVAGRSIAMSLSVCLSMFVRSHIWKNKRPSNFTKCYLHVTSGRGLVLLWRQCNTLCTSGSVDDIMFSHNGPYGAWHLHDVGALMQQVVINFQRIRQGARHAVWLCRRIQRQQIAHRGEACYRRLRYWQMKFAKFDFVDVDTVSLFKARLDKFCMHEDVIHDLRPTWPAHEMGGL